MGCASSKHTKCKHCKAPYSPPMNRRSFSVNAHHSITLKSSTLGSIKLDPCNNSIWDEVEDVEDTRKAKIEEVVIDRSKEFTLGLIEAKCWSNMIDEKIQKVFPRTPPGEPERIDVGELMEGLEGVSPLRFNGEHSRSFSFHVSVDSIPSLVDSPRIKENNGLKKDSLVALEEFDPDVISSFRKALGELSPRNPLDFKSRDVEETVENLNRIGSNEVIEEKKMNEYDCVKGFVDRVTTEDEKENFAPPDYGFVEEDMVENECKYEKKRVVLYFTTLRGVRKTYEDCCYVRQTLKGLGVRVDERDVSMHLGFKEELNELSDKGGFNLPKVFVGDKYFGGIEEIRRLHEDGKLEKVFQGCEMRDGDNNLIGVCEGCGDIRFVPCEECSGSCKIYYDFEEEDEDQEEFEYGFQRCPDCNENGLVRCPLCCY